MPNHGTKSSALSLVSFTTQASQLLKTVLFIAEMLLKF